MFLTLWVVDYPCPLWSVRGRGPLYVEVGHTIMDLLAVSILSTYIYDISSVKLKLNFLEISTIFFRF